MNRTNVIAVSVIFATCWIAIAVADDAFKAPEGPLDLTALLSEKNVERGQAYRQLQAHFYAQVQQLRVVAKQKIDWDDDDGASIRAIRLLAIYRDADIVGFLVSNIDHTTTDGNVFDVRKFDGGYPCAEALVAIGGPASEIIITSLSQLHTPESQRKWCVTVLKEIEGEKYAKLKIRDAMEAERDAGRKEMLRDALEKYFNE